MNVTRHRWHAEKSFWIPLVTLKMAATFRTQLDCSFPYTDTSALRSRAYNTVLSMLLSCLRDKLFIIDTWHQISQSSCLVYVHRFIPSYWQIRRLILQTRLRFLTQVLNPRRQNDLVVFYFGTAFANAWRCGLCFLSLYWCKNFAFQVDRTRDIW